MRKGAWPILCGSLLVLGVLGAQGVLVLLGSTLLVAYWASNLWARWALYGVRYDRRLGATHLWPGEETELVLEFSNAKPLPLPWLLVRDRFPQEVCLLTDAITTQVAGQSPSLISLVTPGWYERIRRRHRVRAGARGVYRFGPAEIGTGDVLGLREVYADAPGREALVVFPRLVPLDAPDTPAGRPVGDFLARRRIVEDPLRYAAVRDYAPGDDPRHIHWKASARCGGLQSKVFDPSHALTLVVALDVRTVARPYEADHERLEQVLGVGATLVLRALEERYAVGLCVNALAEGGATWSMVRPGRHTQQATDLLSALAAVRAVRGLPFEELLVTMRRALPFGASVAMVTAVPHEGVYEAADALRRAGHPTLLLVVGSEAADVPATLPHCVVGGNHVAHALEELAVA